MTPEQIEFHRKRFEESMLLTNDWSRKDFKNVLGDYYDWQVQAMFKGYLMAIESIEIELPMPVFYRDEESPSERNHRYSYNSALNDTLHNIQSLGLKVKER